MRPVVEPTPGGAASEERVDPESYVLDLKLQVRVPAPNRTIDELAQVNPELPRLLPGLERMLTPESVSPFFSDLYETEGAKLCATISAASTSSSRGTTSTTARRSCSLKHPDTRRKAVLIQAEMDVDADGSDSDRLPGRQRHLAEFPAV